MTESQSGEPTQPVEPVAPVAAESAEAAAPTPPAPPVPPVPPVQPVPPPYAAPPPYAYAGYDPTFAPIPRTPWIAPQRKGAAIAISIGAAIILLVIGALIGAGIAHHHDHNTRFDRAGYSGPEHQPGRNGGPGQQRPNIPRPPVPTSTATR